MSDNINIVEVDNNGNETVTTLAKSLLTKDSLLQAYKQQQLDPSSIASLDKDAIKESADATFKQLAKIDKKKNTVPSLTQVTLEIPGGHQFQVYYHEVIVSNKLIILVYDHHDPLQFIYFPPALVNQDTQQPQSLALLLNDKQLLYKVYCPGLRFRHLQYEYCLLVVEEEQDMTKQTPSAGSL